jgi:protein-disulfide isomerase
MQTEVFTDKINRSNYSTPVVIILAGIIIAGVIYFGGSHKVVAPDSNMPVSNQTLSVDIKNVQTTGIPYIGDLNATVTMAVWFDYQCSVCKYNEEVLIDKLVTDYVKTGKMRIVFKNIAFLGLPQITDSLNLALTASAVWEAYPNKFFEWHKVIFSNQGKENTGWATKSVIADLTKKVVGIDTNIIDKLVTDNYKKYQAVIEANQIEGVKFGIVSTPSFIIGDHLFVGVTQNDYTSVRTIIEDLLNKPI